MKPVEKSEGETPLGTMVVCKMVREGLTEEAYVSDDLKELGNEVLAGMGIRPYESPEMGGPLGA